LLPVSPPTEWLPEARVAARKAAAGLRPISFSIFLHLALSLASLSMAAAATPGDLRPDCNIPKKFTKINHALKIIFKIILAQLF